MLKPKNNSANIKSLEQAREFVLSEKICTIFGAKNCPHPSLYDNVDLPEKQPGEKGWGKRITAVWRWKNELPAKFPDEIFYGKIQGGLAALIAISYLKEKHFADNYKPVSELSNLAQLIYQEISLEPKYTGELRKTIMHKTNCTKSKFETELKSLQVSLNITRSNDIKEERDLWLPFRELYPDIFADKS